MTAPSQPLPTNISTGSIVGRFGVVEAADGGFVPATGLIVTFVPSVGVLLDTTAGPDPLSIMTAPVVCSIDTEGYLCGPSEYRGVSLIATDDTDLSSTGWTYRVLFSGAVSQFASFSISVATGSTVDIATVLPTTASFGVVDLWTDIVAASDAIFAAQSAAAASQSAAAASQSAASGSASAAATSASGAATSAGTATTSATAAAASQSAAATSATSAGTSATSALASKNAAATSETNAAGSALSIVGDVALTSASATAASGSATAAHVSELAAEVSNVSATQIATNLSGRVQFDEFLVSGTWTKPAGAKTVEVILIGAGGGGGSGRRGASGTVCGGGGGGSAGLYVRRTFAASDLGTSETVTLYAGGAGGAAVAVNDTNGNNGTLSTQCVFGLNKVVALPGLAGALGSTTGGAGGSPLQTGGIGGAGGTGAAGQTLLASQMGPAGGGGGGGVSATPAAFNGGGGGYCSFGGGATNGAAGVVGGALPTAATNATAKGSPGQSGGGGAASITGAAQAGANSTGYGAGGAGGGASLNGFNSGAGGSGGPGYCLVITTFGMEGSQSLQDTLDAKAPVALTNSCTNPGPASISNWSTNNAAMWPVTYATGEARFERLVGAAAFELASSPGCGFYTATLPLGSTWQFSIDVKPPVDSHTANTSAGIQGGLALPANVYTRIVQNIVGTGASTNPASIRVTADADPGAGGVYTYLRKAMLVQAPPTPIVPYFDGNSPGCRWTGAVLASTSIGPGVPASIVDLSSAQTLANKRVTPRVDSRPAQVSPQPTPNVDTTDIYVLTAQSGACTFAAPTGTPTEGQRLRIRIKDDGAARPLTWNAIYRAGGGLLPSATVAGKQMHLEFAYNATDNVWALLSLGVQDRGGVDVQTFLADGTWIKPPGVTTVLMQAIAGGGGGGSGRRGAAGTVRAGGGGGGSGARQTVQQTAASMPSTMPVGVPAPAAGGALIGNDDTNGNTGVAGGVVWATGIYVTGGNGGLGGTTVGVAGGTGGLGPDANGTSGSASGPGTTGANSPLSWTAPSGGASGGGISAANVPSNGGASISSVRCGNTAPVGPGIVDSTLPGVSSAAHGSPAWGSGGGGGAASITQAAQAGANGGAQNGPAFGGGGGGGGASVNGFASGKGGDGGPGIVIVTSW